MLWDKYDSLILDLDGVVYIGNKPVPYAVESLNAVSSVARITALTNNASRHRSDVANHLQEMGLEIHESDVVTSSDAVSEYVTRHLPTVQKVLVVGGDGLARTLKEDGLEILRAGRSHDENAQVAQMCDAVIEGHGTDTSWWDITTAIWAINLGKPWIVTNRDLTVPLEYGMSIGNGGFVSLIESFTEITPTVTGKPEKSIFDTLISRLSLKNPLVIGDSFHTDIRGARNAGLDSLLVLTGVTHRTMLTHSEIHPTYVADDLRVLLDWNLPKELG